MLFRVVSNVLARSPAKRKGDKNALGGWLLGAIGVSRVHFIELARARTRERVAITRNGAWRKFMKLENEMQWIGMNSSEQRLTSVALISASLITCKPTKRPTDRLTEQPTTSSTSSYCARHLRARLCVSANCFIKKKGRACVQSHTHKFCVSSCKCGVVVMPQWMKVLFHCLAVWYNPTNNNESHTRLRHYEW